MKPQQLSKIVGQALTPEECAIYMTAIMLIISEGAFSFSRIAYMLHICGKQSLQDCPLIQEAFNEWKEVMDKEILEQESIYAQEKNSMEESTS